MPEEKIHTLRPDGIPGRSISKRKYDQMKIAIIQLLHDSDLSHSELITRLNSELKDIFFDNITWFAETLILDLEAREIIEKKNTTFHLK